MQICLSNKLKNTIPALTWHRRGEMSNSKLSITRILSNNSYILKYALKFTPSYVIAVCLFAVFCKIEEFFEFTYCTKYMIDIIQYNGSFTNALIYIGIIAVAIIGKIIFSAILNHYIQPKAKEKLHKNMQMILLEKAANIDLSCYDNPEYYNEFVWSISEANTRIDEAIDYLSKLSACITTILMTGGFFITLDKTGLLFVVASFLLTLVSNVALSQLKFKMDVELKPLQRKRSYINRVFYLNNYAKEIRLNPISPKLKQDFNESNTQILSSVDKHSNKQVILSFLSDYVFNSFILDGLYVLYLLFIAVVKKTLSYGSLLSLYGAAGNLKSNLQRITELIPKLQQNSLYIEKMRAFLDYQPIIIDNQSTLEVPKEPFTLELRNVSFSYQQNKRPILKNISLKIGPNEKIAFVGYNGAGKTTLTKLLMRLYDVSEGEILLNGINIKQYKLDAYRSAFGSVFQDYQLFAATVGENVVMDQYNTSDTNRILLALQDSGFNDKLKTMKDGLNTQLTREFEQEAVNLSGGEAQKVAIARVFAKTCQTIILDEPSSALDPISEYTLNQTMLEAAKNKTVLFISHRLSSTKLADRIYMLEKGEIIEQGTHDELMALRGKYCEMFNLQAEKYINHTDFIKATI